MNCISASLNRIIALCLVLLMVAPLGYASTTALPQTSQSPAPSSQSNAQSPPDRPGTSAANPTLSGPPPVDAGPKPAQTPDPPLPLSTAPQEPAKGQNSPPPPTVGAAAAPAVKVDGIPASRPAGAAIAPGKQRRVRSYAIRIGLLVGAGIAIGTVAAASLGSSSRPQ